jgi:hypothetical protein
MTDIVERLRGLRFVHVPVASDLMAEAAAEIERLREREQTNHDAAPATIARTDADRGRTDKAATRPGEGTGNTQEGRKIGFELIARLRHVADSLEAIARGEVDSPQPFIAAYAVYLNGEYDSSYGPDAIDEALEIAADCHGEVVPLYRTPQAHATPGEGSVPGARTLTDAEREAIYRAEARLRTAYVPDDETAATLRSLLERLA